MSLKYLWTKKYGSEESRDQNILLRSIILYFDYSRTEEISLDKNVPTEITQDEKSEKEPSDEESHPSMGSPTLSLILSDHS